MIAFMSQMVTVVDNCILCNYFGLSLAEEGKKSSMVLKQHMIFNWFHWRLNYFQDVKVREKWKWITVQKRLMDHLCVTCI